MISRNEEIDERIELRLLNHIKLINWVFAIQNQKIHVIQKNQKNQLLIVRVVRFDCILFVDCSLVELNCNSIEIDLSKSKLISIEIDYKSIDFSTSKLRQIDFWISTSFLAAKMNYDSYRIDYDQNQIDHDSIESNYDSNGHDCESNRLDHDVVDSIDFDLVDFDLIDFGQNNFDRIDLDRNNLD